jgi:MFS transporter, DHA1 family, inner membrane transport protein
MSPRQVADSATISPGMQATTQDAPGRRAGGRFVLLSLVLATYLANVSAIAMTPFLLDIARDLDADLAAMGVMLAVGSVTWGIVSIFAGVASDRFGRRPVLMAGLLGLTLAPLGLAVATAYWVGLISRFAGGFGGGSFMGTAFAAAADAVPSSERGRALGWLITGQSLALVIGVPLVAYMGAFIGWRSSLAIQGVLMVIAGILVWLAVPGQPSQARQEAAPAGSVLKLLTPRVIALLSANTMERFCYGGVAVYLATYLTLSYGASLEALAIGLGVVALGNLAGNFVGGELSDKLRSRTVLAALSLAATGGLALPLLLWQPGLIPSIGLGFAYTAVNAIGRPALLASTSEVSREARGALLGVNMTFASIGWLGSQAFGGWLIGTMGFPIFGMLTAVAGVVGALLAIAAKIPGRDTVPDVVR